MSDDTNKTNPNSAPADADSQHRKELAFLADQVTRRVVGALQGQTAGQIHSADCSDIMTALVMAQKSFKVPSKNKTVDVSGKYTYKYADIAAIFEACSDSLAKNDLAIIQPIVQVDDMLYCLTKVIHAPSGQWLSTRLPLGPSKMDPQSIGSALTYMRRYGISSLLGIVTEDDDDGNRGQGRDAHEVQAGYSYRYDDEIIWGTNPLKTKRIGAMSYDDLYHAKERIIKRGQHFKKVGDTIKIADAKRDLDLVQAAIDIQNDTTFDEPEADNAERTTSVTGSAPAEEEARPDDDSASERGGMDGQADPEEGRAEEEMAGVDQSVPPEGTEATQEPGPTDQKWEEATSLDKGSDPNEREVESEDMPDPRNDDTMPAEPASLALNDKLKKIALKKITPTQLLYLQGLTKGEILATSIAEGGLFADASDGINAFYDTVETKPVPLTAAWIVEVWHPYHETDKSTRNDARKLIQIWIEHHDLKQRHAESLAAGKSPKELNNEKSAVDAVMGAFDAKTRG